MKSLIFLITFIVVFQGCTQVTKELKEQDRQNVVKAITENLVKELPNPSISTDNSGNTFVTQDEMTITIDKNRIHIDYIDEDDKWDYVYTLMSSYGGNSVEAVHFCFLTKSMNELEIPLGPNDFVTRIYDKKIYVKSMEYSEDDPRCCPSIEKLNKYAFVGGKLVLTD